MLKSKPLKKVEKNPTEVLAPPSVRGPGSSAHGKTSSQAQEDRKECNGRQRRSTTERREQGDVKHEKRKPEEDPKLAE